MTTIAELRARAQRARENFETNRSRLYRGDGEPVYGAAEMAERLRELSTERNQALDAVETELEEQRSELTTTLQVLEDGDPSSWLTAEEQDRAGARLALIAADVQALGTEDLRRRLEAVTHSSDRSSQLGYWLASRGCLKGGDVETSALLESLQEAIIPESRRQRMESARSTLAEISEVRTSVYLARRGQNSPYEPAYAVTGPQSR